jgi:hypothetical protein
MEHVLGELSYWIDLMSIWVVGWIAGSENKAHGKMASLFAQPYISPPDYDTVEFPSKKEMLLAQQSAVDEYERRQQGSAMARQEVPPQQVDAGGMRMMNKALRIPERAVELQLRLYVEAHCRSAGHRAYEATLGAIKEYVAWTTMDNDGCQGLCAELFALCRHCSWRQSAASAGYAATCNQSQRDPALRLLEHRVVKRREVSVLATSHG